MIAHSNKNSILYQELNTDEHKKIFDRTKSKFLHNIDSLYYVVHVNSNWSDCPNAQKFKNYLSIARDQAQEKLDLVPVFQELGLLGLVTTGFSPQGYAYDFQLPDSFRVFIANGVPNENTPPIHVFISSQELWLKGEHNILKGTLDVLERVLKKFDIKITDVVENRIDYAYHTNYIQDMLTFFPEDKLNAIQQSRFTRMSKEYQKIGEWHIDTDYITFGRKKSNNIFFRAYNKTKEVVEMGYKQFFLQIWYSEKMINYFDFWCLEKAFLQGRWKYLDIARLEFYLEYGNNQFYKDKVKKLLNAQNLDYDKIIKLGDLLVGKVTQIVNIEIETKRKFYYSFREVKNMLSVRTVNAPVYATNIYKIIDNKQVFHDFITWRNVESNGIIRFLNLKGIDLKSDNLPRKKDVPTSDFWHRLQRCDLKNVQSHQAAVMIRKYQNDIDIENIKTRTLNQIASLDVYLNKKNYHEELSVELDLIQFSQLLNENDLMKLPNKKQKKFTQLKSRLENVEKTDTKTTLTSYNHETGEFEEKNSGDLLKNLREESPTPIIVL